MHSWHRRYQFLVKQTTLWFVCSVTGKSMGRVDRQKKRNNGRSDQDESTAKSRQKIILEKKRQMNLKSEMPKVCNEFWSVCLRNPGCFTSVRSLLVAFHEHAMICLGLRLLSCVASTGFSMRPSVGWLVRYHIEALYGSATSVPAWYLNLCQYMDP